MHTKNTIKKKAYVNLKVQRRNLNLPTISLNTIWPSLLPFRYKECTLYNETKIQYLKDAGKTRKYIRILNLPSVVEYY